MGNHTGTDLGADLFALRRAANMLERMSDGYHRLTGTVAGTEEDDDKAFAGHGCAPSRTLSAWTALRDRYQSVLDTTRINLHDTNVALLRCINEYASQDRVAAAELRRQIKDNNRSDDVDHFPVPDRGDRTPVDVPDDRDRDAVDDFPQDRTGPDADTDASHDFDRGLAPDAPGRLR